MPPTETLEFFNVFLQDQLALGAGAELTLGSKFEHNDYTGWEVQPNVRLGWRLSEDWMPIRRTIGAALAAAGLRNYDPFFGTVFIFARERPTRRNNAR